MFDRAHHLAVAACPVGAAHVAVEKRERIRRYNEDVAQPELRGWLIPLGST